MLREVIYVDFSQTVLIFTVITFSNRFSMFSPYQLPTINVLYNFCQLHRLKFTTSDLKKYNFNNIDNMKEMNKYSHHQILLTIKLN